MNVLMVEPGKAPYEMQIGSDLQSMQALVGGYIQAVYAWVDTLEDLRLLQAIKTLSIEELEILTFLTLEEHSQKELAERWGCSQRAISKKFQKIKKIFQKWF